MVLDNIYNLQTNYLINKNLINLFYECIQVVMLNSYIFCKFGYFSNSKNKKLTVLITNLSLVFISIHNIKQKLFKLFK